MPVASAFEKIGSSPAKGLRLKVDLAYNPAFLEVADICRKYLSARADYCGRIEKCRGGMQPVCMQAMGIRRERETLGPGFAHRGDIKKDLST